MVESQPKLRVSIDEALHHPLLWPLERQLDFICEVSDMEVARKETEPSELRDLLEAGAAKGLCARVLLLFARRAPPLCACSDMRLAVAVVGEQWDADGLPNSFLSPKVGARSPYVPRRFCHLLRLIRNRKAHFHELDEETVARLPVPHSVGILLFFYGKYPRLFLHVYSSAAYLYAKGRRATTSVGSVEEKRAEPAEEKRRDRREASDSEALDLRRFAALERVFGQISDRQLEQIVRRHEVKPPRGWWSLYSVNA